MAPIVLIFKCIFLTENIRILIRISMKFIPKSAIDHGSSLVQVMACLSLVRRQATFWTNDDPVHWHKYAPLGPNKLIVNKVQFTPRRGIACNLQNEPIIKYGTNTLI